MCNTEFFRSCVSHQNAKKNELDRFCIDCAQSFCSHCSPAHALHKHVKVLDIYGDDELCCLKHEDEEAGFLLRPTLTKRPRLRHSRKGVPLRAPMF
ncbi:hypothetical protein V6N13_069783 [Hibiscus sabdariffa]